MYYWIYHFLWMLISWKTRVQYHNHDTDIDTVKIQNISVDVAPGGPVGFCYFRADDQSNDMVVFCHTMQNLCIIRKKLSLLFWPQKLSFNKVPW